MTKETYNILLPYAKQLRSAKNSNFARMSEGDMKKINEAYFNEFGLYISKSQMLCSTCKLNALKRLCEKFDAYEAKIERMAAARAAKNTESGKDSNLVAQDNVEGTIQ